MSASGVTREAAWRRECRQTADNKTADNKTLEHRNTKHYRRSLETSQPAHGEVGFRHEPQIDRFREAYISKAQPKTTD